tara:strand:- start:15865 stop:16971 length:1107 start_codon:yes stop_codon:yes gene_type:complete
MSASFYRPGYSSSGSSSQVMDESVPKSGGAKWGYIWAIVGISIIVVALVLTIILVALRYRRNIKAREDAAAAAASSTTTTTTTTTPCATPMAPQNVVVTYNIAAMTASITWSSVAGASSYYIYRKLEDPAVSKTNYQSKVETIQLFENYINLPSGTHYFVVTAKNSCGNESMASAPAKFAPICSSTPAAPIAPTVSTVNDNCTDPIPYKSNEIYFPWASFPGGSYIIQASGQQGGVSQLFMAADRDLADPSGTAPSGGVEVNMDCSGSDSYSLTYITNIDHATVTSIVPTSTGTTLSVSWNPIAGAEQYTVFAAGVGSDNILHFYGSYADGNVNTMTFPVNAGEEIVELRVNAFRLCDRSTATVFGPV